MLSSNGSSVYLTSSNPEEITAHRVSGEKLWARTFSGQQVICARTNEPFRELVVMTKDGLVGVLDTADGKLKRSFRLLDSPNTADVSVDGKVLATLTETGIPQFWDLETLRPISSRLTPQVARELTTHTIQFGPTNRDAFVFRVGAIPSELIRIDAAEWDWATVEGKCLMAAQRMAVDYRESVAKLAEGVAVETPILQLAADRHAEHSPTHLGLARGLRRAGQTQEAVKLLENTLERTIDRPISLLNELAVANRDANDLRGLFSTRREILSRTAAAGDIVKLAAQADEIREASPKISLDAVKQLTERIGNRRDSEAKQILFNLQMTAMAAYLANGEWAEAESLLKSLETDPLTLGAMALGGPIVRAAIGSIRANTYLGSGRPNDYRKLTREMVKALSPEPTGKELTLTLIAAYSVSEALDDWSVLLPRFDRLRKLQAFDADLTCLHGCVLYRSGKTAPKPRPRNGTTRLPARSNL